MQKEVFNEFYFTVNIQNTDDKFVLLFLNCKNIMVFIDREINIKTSYFNGQNYIGTKLDLYYNIIIKCLIIRVLFIKR